jgi:3-methyl-2-oxobutanoate hydroxymethyltransferase
MTERVTTLTVQKMKAEGRPIVCLTAYDSPSAVLAEECGVDVILVGDSLGNVIQGRDTTLYVTLDEAEYHTQCVARHATKAMIVADLPFGSYQVSPQQAVESSIRLMKAGAQAVKLEGAYTDAIEAVVKAGIPLMGHAGLTPQSIHAFGGFRVQGRGSQAERVKSDCRAIQAAGAFSVVLELTPAKLSEEITAELEIPTIGIGAGSQCSGQIQVWHDILSLNGPVFKHSKAFVEGRKILGEGISSYVNEVRNRTFPAKENSF